jgi:hypothetical protein
MTPHITKNHNMRKITKEAVKNFIDKVPFKKDNTEVVREGTIFYLKLFNNKIAALEGNGKMWISNAGWKSNTTKERLNALPGVNIYQRKKIWYLNDTIWNGEPTYINIIK